MKSPDYARFQAEGCENTDCPHYARITYELAGSCYFDVVCRCRGDCSDCEPFIKIKEGE